MIGLKNFNDHFPLTPALFLRERGKTIQCLEN